MIYADHAATTRLDQDAFEAMKPFLMEEYGNASQPYSFARKPRKALNDARITIAECINASPEEIFFTSGGTESDNWAIKGTAEYGDNGKIIASEIEHHAVLNACAEIQRWGIPTDYLPADASGIIHPDELSKRITKKTRLVSVMMVNNEIGTVEPIREIAETAHRYGALFHTDAVQAVGHIPVDVGHLSVDLLSASAHKFNGPKGVGFLYARKGIHLSAYINGGGQEFGMRAGTENIASIVGMATALRKNCSHLEENAAHLMRVEAAFLDALERSGLYYQINGGNQRIPGNVSVSFANADGEMLLHRLDLKGICVSTGSACNGQSNQISHVLQSIGLPQEYAKGTIRISFGIENTETEAVMIVEAIKGILHRKERQN